MIRFGIDRKIAQQVLRLFDHCFKQGVLDACDFEDNMAARQWVEDRLSDGSFGLLSEVNTKFDWKRWRFVIERWCRDGNIGTLGTVYLDRVRYRSSYVYAIIPLSMRFYILGVEEWLEYPNNLRIEPFLSEPRIHWKPVDRHLRKITEQDMLSLIQQFIYERQDKGYPNDMTSSRYDSFALAMWTMTRKFSKV